ncbi:TPA: hypothetical protein SL229_006379, partial [Pseudomonas aeruginosa]|nr:hypothetical protein [Pseudomonas aeruginosa]HEJ2749786.1 hypothetical protein [Pseudomonas aeruginosa]HEJ4639172.1 hypothetical protein [Pseudomonas aeruginosa]
MPSATVSKSCSCNRCSSVTLRPSVAPDGHIADFAELLHAVAALDGVERIRYTTSHPLEFSDAI